MKNDWISNLNVGDSVYTIERHKKIPNGFWKWESKVTAIETNYIETCFERDYNLEWLLEQCKDLAPYHRTFSKQWVKNYFAPERSINIENIVL